MKAQKQRALALYASEGFVEEGRLRESVRVTAAQGSDPESAWHSLVMLSPLDREYAGRVSQGLEPA